MSACSSAFTVVELFAMGVQASALEHLPRIVQALPRELAIPVVLSCPRWPGDGLHPALWASCPLPVLEPNDKTPLQAGRVYLCPAGYQLWVDERCAALAPEGFGPPGQRLDRFFQSAADAYGQRARALFLRGADDRDGELGMAALRAVGASEGELVVEPRPPSVSSAGDPARSILRMEGISLWGDP